MQSTRFTLTSSKPSCPCTGYNINNCYWCNYYSSSNALFDLIWIGRYEGHNLKRLKILLTCQWCHNLFKNPQNKYRQKSCTLQILAKCCFQVKWNLPCVFGYWAYLQMILIAVNETSLVMLREKLESELEVEASYPLRKNLKILFLPLLQLKHPLSAEYLEDLMPSVLMHPIQILWLATLQTD